MESIQVVDFNFPLDLSKPLYEQVLQQIRHAIARGDVLLGTKLPSVRDLAQQLKINPNTVMRAYQELDRDHLTETRRGQGTFITSDYKTVKYLSKSYGTKNALDDLYVSFPEGQITGLLSPNGAGKSTLFKAIVGLVKPQAGQGAACFRRKCGSPTPRKRSLTHLSRCLSAFVRFFGVRS